MAAAAQGGGNLITRKLGPLPTWAWLLIATGLFGAYYLIERNKAKTAAAATASPSTTAASNVPDYVFQNYNQMPPVTPAPKPPASSSPAPGVQSGPLITNVIGQPLGASIQQAQQQGWTLGNIYNGSGTSLAKNPQTYAMKVVSYNPHTTGQAGKYSAGSVDFVVA